MFNMSQFGWIIKKGEKKESGDNFYSFLIIRTE